LGESVRRGGEFYSSVVHQDRQEHLLLTELQQPTGRTIPRHEHELAYVTVILDGNYAEGWTREPTELEPFTSVFNPPGVAHAGVVGSKGTRLFTIEWSRSFAEQIGLVLPAGPVVDAGCGELLWPSLRMFAEFKSHTADPLVQGSHLVEMLGNLAGLKQDKVTTPPWFHRVKERLHSEFRQSLRVCDVASEAGVHPVHLARVFRLREKQSLGDYVQRLRIRAACQLLRDERASLALVAADCGFADQPHFNRVFKKIMNVSPGRFRRAFQRASSGISQPAPSR
jgi:AraC family transcriptional regulator